MYRNTYVEINLNNIKYNVKKLIERYNEYKYYFGVVKADCYGHDDNKVVKAIMDAGCNYLVVATLDEALEIRKEFNEPALRYIRDYITINSLRKFDIVKNIFNVLV